MTEQTIDPVTGSKCSFNIITMLTELDQIDGIISLTIVYENPFFGKARICKVSNN